MNSLRPRITRPTQEIQREQSCFDAGYAKGRADLLKEMESIDWTEIMRSGSLVTWGDAGTLGYRVVEKVRELYVLPKEKS